MNWTKAFFLIIFECFCIINIEISAGSILVPLNSIKIMEEMPIGTVVANLADNHRLIDLVSNYEFRFSSKFSKGNEYFQIDENNGRISIKKRIDREYMCEAKICNCKQHKDCRLQLDISLEHKNNEDHKILIFDIIILDLNEFPPRFPNKSIVINVNEESLSEILVGSAMDDDSTKTNISYSLLPINGTNITIEAYQANFIELNSKIQLSTNTNKHLSINIKTPFDYETQREFQFQIKASDEGPEVLSGFCLVTLKILDLNDNVPIFDNDKYELLIPESSATANTKLIQVQAHDNDSSLNRLVHYSLIDTKLSEKIAVSDFFKIEKSGWIKIKENRTLDFDELDVYVLTVRAQDSGRNSIPVYTTVYIRLIDVNDNMPVITYEFFENKKIILKNSSPNASNTTDISVSLFSSIEPNSYISRLFVNDADSDINSELQVLFNVYLIRKNQYDLQAVANRDFAIVFVDNSYYLRTNVEFDKSSIEYMLEFSATDCGKFERFTTYLRIYVNIIHSLNYVVNSTEPSITLIDEAPKKSVGTHAFVGNTSLVEAVALATTSTSTINATYGNAMRQNVKSESQKYFKDKTRSDFPFSIMDKKIFVLLVILISVIIFNIVCCYLISRSNPSI
jgi:hypothetical protein